MPFPSMQLRSFRCHCPARHFSSMPSLCYSGLRQSTATQYDSLQYNSFPFIAIADQNASALIYAFAFTSLPDVALLVFAVALRFSSLPLLIRASPHHSLLLHCDSMLSSAIALPIWTDLCIAMPLLFNSKHCLSLPPHYISMLFTALAMLYISSPCLCSSERSTALPLQVYSLQRSAMAFLCSSTPGLAIAMQR